jgi:hypothetical protein
VLNSGALCADAFLKRGPDQTTGKTKVFSRSSFPVGWTARNALAWILSDQEMNADLGRMAHGKQKWGMDGGSRI